MRDYHERQDKKNMTVKAKEQKTEWKEHLEHTATEWKEHLKYAALVLVVMCYGLVNGLLAMAIYLSCMLICTIILCLDWIFDIYGRIVDDKDIYRAACQPYQVKVPDNSRWKYHTIWKYRMITKPAFRHVARIVMDDQMYGGFFTSYNINHMYTRLPENTYTILNDAHGHGYQTEKEAWAAYLQQLQRNRRR